MTDSSLFILLHFAGMIYSSSFIPTLPIQPLNWNILASTFFPDHCVIPLSSNLTQSWLSILFPRGLVFKDQGKVWISLGHVSDTATLPLEMALLFLMARSFSTWCLPYLQGCASCFASFSA